MRLASWQFLRCIYRQNLGIKNEMCDEFLLVAACLLCCCTFQLNSPVIY